MELKNYIAESFTKEYAYRVKLAHDCGADQMDMIEKCLAKYNFVSASPFKRSPTLLEKLAALDTTPATAQPIFAYFKPLSKEEWLCVALSARPENDIVFIFSFMLKCLFYFLLNK
mgnify:CR=1 FL=1